MVVIDKHEIHLATVLEGAETVQGVAKTLDFLLPGPTGLSAANMRPGICRKRQLVRSR